MQERLFGREFLERAGFAFTEGLVFEDLISSFQLLCKAPSVVLIDEPLYFHRVDRPGQITGRKDHSLLDAVPAFNLILDELWNYPASAELWANLIFFQGWLLLWLTSQITDRYRERFIAGVAGIALKFPPQGITRFREKFHHDPKVTAAVELQLYGDSGLYAESARTGVASERADKVVHSGLLRRFFIARSHVTSRLAYASSQRRRGKAHDSPLTRGRRAGAAENAPC